MSDSKSKLRIVCLGDSITYGFPWGPEASWVKMLGQALDAEIINKGINGNTTWDMMNRFDRAVLKYNPTHVIIMGGINDVICGESFDRITYNLRIMVNKALDAGIKVVLGLPTAIDNEYWEKMVHRIRTWMRELAAEKGIPIIDFAAAFFDANGNIKKELLLADGGHPDIEGYQEMFKQIDLSIFQT
ncbi:SGNH/GDSL hydrolase family protein [Syntrophomonas palmitatica]|uniref:SGNH/GDSL hydrolase family protein n=1 Tax=Syntrophomonas palmitatica TaxID=402877 RepID=UPI0006D240A4|nr:SGNH/GDSL hydrolase family protein [Syntrophomonas palmitatica]